jgi:hypothetical protein
MPDTFDQTPTSADKNRLNFYNIEACLLRKQLALTGLRKISIISVPASFLTTELTVVHTTDCTTTDHDPTLFTFKLNDLMGLNHGIEQRWWNLVNLTVRIPNQYQPPESENPHI